MISVYSPQITPKSSYSQSENKCSHKTSCLAPHTQPAATPGPCYREILQPPRSWQSISGERVALELIWGKMERRDCTFQILRTEHLPSPEVLKALTNKPTCIRYHIPLCPASPDILSISLLQCASFQGLCSQESLLLCTSVFPQVELGLIGNPPRCCRYTEWDPCSSSRTLPCPKYTTGRRHSWEQAGPPAEESVQFSRSVVSDSLQPHESQHTRPPCPSPTPRVHPNSCALSG